ADNARRRALRSARSIPDLWSVSGRTRGDVAMRESLASTRVTGFVDQVTCFLGVVWPARMNVPIGRAAQLRQALDEQFSEFLATIGPLSDAQWAWPCPREGWPVGYVAHHVGQGIVRPSGWITQALAG